ncbi:hypothetical protein [Tumebacillus flagellatus]|uniref:Peptidase MA-like domain-containing protein n=1 Tax=Tumebacillus flagellatus TaxID=1157490 RepID=A0A074LI42_9BACL|nr:hypothetical protein [Tumebacillus flagellatus]KEO81896.1 hypothetical protein EL26_18860 [Tumebacillus flagellatus]
MFRRRQVFLFVLLAASLALTGCNVPLLQKKAFSPYEITKADDGVTDAQTALVEKVLDQDHLMQTVGEEYGFAYRDTVSIQLASGDDGYRKLLSRDGKSKETLDREVKYTDASVYRNNISINLAKRKSETDVRSTLAHELTHILFNQNSVKIPSWVNEGLAQRMGMREEVRGQPPVVQEGQQLKVLTHVLQNKQEQGELKLLVDNLDTIHTMSSTYNVEWLDYLAVNNLWEEQGAEKFREYLAKTEPTLKLKPADTFASVFGLKQDRYESEYNETLADALKQPDRGVKLSFNVTEKSPGKLLIRQAGAQDYNVFNLVQGENHVTVKPDNTVDGLKLLNTYKGKAEAKPNVLFLMVYLDKPKDLEGKLVKSYGVAVSRTFGRYYYLNSFLNVEGEASNTSHNVKLPGLELTGVETANE